MTPTFTCLALFCSRNPTRSSTIRRFAAIAFNRLRENAPNKRGKRATLPEAASAKSKDLLIECKRTQFNMMKNGKGLRNAQGEFQLASQAWPNRKSNGDFFIIHPSLKERDIADECSTTFKEVGVCQQLCTWLEKKNFMKPTEIQRLSMKPIMNGYNTLLAAETGCGKTLAYLLPMVQQINDWCPLMPNMPNTPKGIVISPSRELAFQIGDIAKDLTEEMGLSSHVVIGGSIKRKMMHPLIEKVDLLVATFGALSKLVTAGVYDLSQVQHVVLDEADTLLDDSFNDHLKYFLKKIPFLYKCERIPGQRPYGAQLTLASATMPKDVGPILEGIIEEDSLARVTTSGLHQVIPCITQKFQRMGKKHAPEEMLRIVKSAVASKKPVLIFSNKSSTCDWISIFLNNCGISCTNLNADMSRILRQDKFNQFQEGIVDVLSTTDIGSRGLDTRRAQIVLNYDFPMYMADYIHRCGRVGRVGSSTPGKVINFICGPMESQRVQLIETAARNKEALPNVNANIAKIISNKELHRANRELKMQLHSK